MPMPQPKKLIEVAMPVKEVSAESVRDKSIRHGHISTLHLWWARRPLPVSRAVVFASLVPDPLDPNCPAVFTEAVKLLLGKQPNGTDPYKPYDDIPYTSAIDRVDDNARNRLLMFIGKFSDEFARNEKLGKATPAGLQLSNASLIKWDNKNNEAILGIARKLIWVAHNSANATGQKAKEMLADFDAHYKAIKDAEATLYGLQDRHLDTAAVKDATKDLERAIEAFLDKMPRVFDPFAGGGAIPLEAARLGCRSYGNDINPVAHVIQKASLEYPQRFGKPITYSKAEFVSRYGHAAWDAAPSEDKTVVKGETTAIRIANRLSYDVEFYAKRMLDVAEREIGQYYPADKKGKKPIAYYWARTGTCSNPSCRAEVPLLKGFYLVNKPSKQVHLRPIIKGKRIDFEIVNGKFDGEGWISRGNLTCPCCSNTTDVKTLKKQFIDDVAGERMLAVIWDGQNGKDYRLPTQEELNILEMVPRDSARPTERMPVEYTQALPSCTWGLSQWGQMFSNRQLFSLQAVTSSIATVKEELGLKGNACADGESGDVNEYNKAVLTYLGLLLDRFITRFTRYNIWDTGYEKVAMLFGRQAIPMNFDYPEVNPYSQSGGNLGSQIEWVNRYIISESNCPFSTTLKNSSSGEREQFERKYLNAVITDPPYYDAIAYADLSDFFYVWLKRTIGEVYPSTFATPQTPKTEECIMAELQLKPSLILRISLFRYLMLLSIRHLTL